mgnify:FL=1
MTIKQEIIKLTNINKQLKRNYNSNKKKIKSLEKLDIELFEKILKDNKINEFLQAVQTHFGYNYLVKCRRPKYVMVRSAVIYNLCNRFAGTLKLKQLGKLINDMDHSTVIHNRDLMRDMIDTDNDLFKKCHDEIEILSNKYFENAN